MNPELRVAPDPIPDSRDAVAARVVARLRTIPDFPNPGVMFRDITPLLADHALLRDALHYMTMPFFASGITHVVGIESRGFMFGVPIALALGAAFVPARKPGKLPWKTARESYALEYSEDALEMHVDALASGNARVLIVDDVLATGGTSAGASRLVHRLGGEVVGISLLAELTALGGRARLAPTRVEAVVTL